MNPIPYTQYKGFIYLISAEPFSNKYYIGLTTKKLSLRLYCHIAERNKKHNPKTNWINKYRTVLKIEEIETIINTDRDKLTKELQYWEEFYIALFKSWGVALLNYTNGGEGYKAKHSQKTKDLLSHIQTGRKRGKYNWTVIGKERILAGRKKLIGRKHSELSKQKIGSAQKGEKNHRFGKTPNESILKCGIPVLCIETGILYRSIKSANVATNVDRRTISSSCYRFRIGKAQKRSGLSFKFYTQPL